MPKISITRVSWLICKDLSSFILADNTRNYSPSYHLLACAKHLPLTDDRIVILLTIFLGKF